MDKKEILTNNGEYVMADCPMVISASRETDIPAFYMDWLMDRMDKGYSAWINPYNNKKSYISYDNCHFIVFWSKNPEPLLQHIDKLTERGIGMYIQYTLNDYDNDRLELNVPNLETRIETFKKLVGKLGKGHVIWRFDPLILTDKIGIDELLHKIEKTGDMLKGYTEKLVFSFADIRMYKKVQGNLDASGIKYREWTEDDMKEFGRKLVTLNEDKGWNYVLATCGERIKLDGVMHNHCIDERMITRFMHDDSELMDYMGVKICKPEENLFGEIDDIPDNAIPFEDGSYALCGTNKDKGQREFCGCMKSRDIGQYNTCPHMCEYCYANSNKEKARENYERHKLNPYGETLI